jgi:hypothetical protein
MTEITIEDRDDFEDAIDEIERLKKVCEGALAEQFRLNSEVERLQLALRRIDGINDKASIFNWGIYEVIEKTLDKK